MRMIEAESEALRLCPGSTVFLEYERAHFRNLSPQGDTGFQIQCKIWVAEHKQHYTGANWETAIMRLRNAMQVNEPQPCPDEEAPAA